MVDGRMIMDRVISEELMGQLRTRRLPERVALSMERAYSNIGTIRSVRELRAALKTGEISLRQFGPVRLRQLEHVLDEIEGAYPVLFTHPRGDEC